LIVDVVNQKVTNGELFTAYDISKCVQAEEKKQGLPFTRHLEIKGDVHRAIAPHLVENGGGYARTLVPIANPQPWLYHPINADPANYIPYGATQPIGSTVNVLTPPAAPSLGGNGKTKMLPGGVMQPPPADDGATALGKAITAPVAAPPLPASDDDDDFQNRSPDARGTLCVPSQLLHEAGIYPGDKTVVVAGAKADGKPCLLVRKQNEADTGLTEYTVDVHGNVRITAFTLVQGKLPGPTYNFEGKDNEVYVL